MQGSCIVHACMTYYALLSRNACRAIYYPIKECVSYKYPPSQAPLPLQPWPPDAMHEFRHRNIILSLFQRSLLHRIRYWQFILSRILQYVCVCGLDAVHCIVCVCISVETHLPTHFPMHARTRTCTYIDNLIEDAGSCACGPGVSSDAMSLSPHYTHADKICQLVAPPSYMPIPPTTYCNTTRHNTTRYNTSYHTPPRRIPLVLHDPRAYNFP